VPIGVRTGGLPPELGARIATRIMDIAESVGVAVNRAELCAPNVRIGFTDAPQAMVEQAARRNRWSSAFTMPPGATTRCASAGRSRPGTRPRPGAAAWLRALYSVDPTWAPQLQRGTVVLNMADRLGGGR
jgi:hypothetical protein